MCLSHAPQSVFRSSHRKLVPLETNRFCIASFRSLKATFAYPFQRPYVSRRAGAATSISTTHPFDWHASVPQQAWTHPRARLAPCANCYQPSRTHALPNCCDLHPPYRCGFHILIIPNPARSFYSLPKYYDRPNMLGRLNMQPLATDAPYYRHTPCARVKQM